MWKFFVALLMIAFIIAAISLGGLVKEDKVRASSFRASWNTRLVGTIDSLQLATGDTGIIYFTIASLKGNRFDLSQFVESPFYLLTNGQRGKLVEGGMNLIQKGDVLIIENKQFVILRNRKKIITRPIYFRDAPSLWRNIDLDKAKKYWSWQ